MPSKMVTDRQKSSESVQAACNTHRDAMASGIAETLGDPSLVKNALTLITKAVDRLREDTAAMITADDANIRERGEDSNARTQHEQATAALREELIDLRGGVASILGANAVRTLGYVGDTPNDPIALERLAKTVVGSLDKLAAIKPRREGFSLDPKPWKERITACAAAATSARNALTTELRESEATQTAKDKAIERYDRTFTHVATLASAQLDIAGEHELARRVRPSVRRPGRTVEDAGEPPTPEEPPVQ